MDGSALSVVPYGQENVPNLANRALVSNPVEDTEDLPNWAAAARAAESKKAVDLRILDLREPTSSTDYSVICTAGNPRQSPAAPKKIQHTPTTSAEFPASA